LQSDGLSVCRHSQADLRLKKLMLTHFQTVLMMTWVLKTWTPFGGRGVRSLVVVGSLVL